MDSHPKPSYENTKPTLARKLYQSRFKTRSETCILLTWGYRRCTHANIILKPRVRVYTSKVHAVGFTPRQTTAICYPMATDSLQSEVDIGPTKNQDLLSALSSSSFVRPVFLISFSASWNSLTCTRKSESMCQLCSKGFQRTRWFKSKLSNLMLYRSSASWFFCPSSTNQASGNNFLI